MVVAMQKNNAKYFLKWNKIGKFVQFVSTNHSPLKTKRKFEILYSEEIDRFLSLLPEKAKRKIMYNIELVAGGVVDKELFKKLGDTDIWEFRTLFAGVCYRILAFWDTEANAIDNYNTWICKKNAENASKGNK